jgi:heme/copper-type cytochrome/quinol oxidase subunit 2
MMDSFSNEQRDPALLAKAGRRRQFGVALTQLALTVALIVSIVVVLAVAGASGAMAQARTDLMVMEESTGLTTALIVGVIVVVMGLLTVLAIRDASPNKRSSRRTHPSRR